MGELVAIWNPLFECLRSTEVAVWNPGIPNFNYTFPFNPTTQRVSVAPPPESAGPNSARRLVYDLKDDLSSFGKAVGRLISHFGASHSRSQLPVGGTAFKVSGKLKEHSIYDAILLTAAHNVRTVESKLSDGSTITYRCEQVHWLPDTYSSFDEYETYLNEDRGVRCVILFGDDVSSEPVTDIDPILNAPVEYQLDVAILGVLKSEVS